MKGGKRGKPGADQTSDVLGGYFTDLIRRHGRALYWDTSAILNCFSPEDGRFVNYLAEVDGQPLATSTFVVTETVRRMVKSETPNKFIGPGGARKADLARYLLTNWLQEHRITVLHPDPEVFNRAREVFLNQHHVFGCDLCDTLSYIMVKGLEQERIVAVDRHFRSMGLMCLPA